ncbi:AI-2E family transporter [Paenibacillus mendelii]|uniref:AI-2E family transporter n=1 Tax=Paenibacillus mendelii TaxID=206163 RepID=A0ABV6JFM1_9BACL|nr:AI-2E family transporter [Paenibacillus mendelii]MCQ6557593.1 AI-2E family transporter [Paenibacillus mendelii]
MNTARIWSDRFKFLFLNNRFVLFLLILFLIAINIFVLSKISFVFKPFIVLFKTVLLPLLLTGVVYYLLKPLVDFLERNKLRRIYAIIALYLLIIGTVALLIIAVIPLIRVQVTSLIENIPVYSREIEEKFRSLIGSTFFNDAQQALGLENMNIMSSITERASSILKNAWQRVGGVLGAVTETILAIVTVPFVLFYLLKDGRKLPDHLLSYVPTSMREETRRILEETNHQISSYIRGQVLVSFCIGGLLYVGYRIIGLEYSLVLAIIAACTSVVPYLGPAIAITPALVVATVTSPAMLLKMIAIWTIVQLIEGKFISPQIMGKTLHIHPVTIIFVILTAGNLFGIVGIILAVPGYAVLKVLMAHGFQWFKVRSKLYHERHNASSNAWTAPANDDHT